MIVLVFNPGGNSLKVEIVEASASQRHAAEAQKLASVSIEGIGKSAHVLVFDGKKVIRTAPIHAHTYAEAATSIFAWLETHADSPLPQWSQIDCVGVRVVHGGPRLTSATRITPAVEREIAALESLAPLHNKNSIAILKPIRRRLRGTPIYAVFDTAFHRTIPAQAAIYPIPLSLSRKHRIRRYGFHGISHRYMLERYAHLCGKPVSRCNLITMHLESGCSMTAIRDGRSIDNTMGFTPLEGLMMGTRSGDIDPSLIPFLMREEKMTIDETMTLLNKQSGLVGVSGKSLDTRILMKHYRSDPRAKLAMDMFAYRLRKACGAYLAALGSADAIVFGGGIGENGVFVRNVVAKGLAGFGLQINSAVNKRLIDREGRLSTAQSRIAAWVIPVEEGLQIAHECVKAVANTDRRRGATSSANRHI